MKEHPIACVILSNGENTIIDQDDYPKVQGYTWNKHPLGYAQATKMGIYHLSVLAIAKVLGDTYGNT